MSQEVLKDIKRAIAFIAHPLTGGKTDKPSIMSHLQTFDGASTALTAEELEEAQQEATEALGQLRSIHPQNRIPKGKTKVVLFIEKNLGLVSAENEPSLIDQR